MGWHQSPLFWLWAHSPPREAETGRRESPSLGVGGVMDPILEEWADVPLQSPGRRTLQAEGPAWHGACREADCVSIWQQTQVVCADQSQGWGKGCPANMAKEGQGPALYPSETRGSRGLVPHCLK